MNIFIYYNPGPNFTNWSYDEYATLWVGSGLTRGLDIFKKSDELYKYIYEEQFNFCINSSFSFLEYMNNKLTKLINDGIITGYDISIEFYEGGFVPDNKSFKKN